MRKANLMEGKRYTGVVDRFSSSGNAIISTESGHTNLGPIDRSAAGEAVAFVYWGNCWGKCTDDRYTDESYSPKDSQSTSSESSGSRSQQDSNNRSQTGMSPIENDTKIRGRNMNDPLNGHH